VHEGSSFTPIDSDSDPRVEEIHTFFRAAFNGRSFRSMLSALATDVEVFSFAYWRIHRQGDLVWYERLDPRLTHPVLNKEHTDIDSYVIKRAQSTGGRSFTVDSVSGSEVVPAKEVIRFNFEGGDAVYGGPSALEALDLTVSMDLSIRLHRNAFFRNGATHGTYILLPEATPEQAKDFEKSLRGLKTGAMKAYAPIVIAGQNADIKRFADAGKQEIDFVKGTELSRDEIAAVFAVPMGKLLFSGNALGSSGKSEDDDTFQRDCVLPLEEMIYETLTREILIKEFEIDDLALIPRRRASVRTDKFTSAKDLVAFGGTGNEARDLVGLPKIEDPTMDVPMFLGRQGGTLPEPPGASLSQDDAAAAGGEKISNTNDKQKQENKNEVAKAAKASPFERTSDYSTKFTNGRSTRTRQR
jgi:hypothetical protein